MHLFYMEHEHESYIIFRRFGPHKWTAYHPKKLDDHGIAAGTGGGGIVPIVFCKSNTHHEPGSKELEHTKQRQTKEPDKWNAVNVDICSWGWQSCTHILKPSMSRLFGEEVLSLVPNLNIPCHLHPDKLGE